MSFSQFVFDRYQQRSKRRIIASLIYIVAAAAYLIWRATIFAPDAQWLSALYFLAEAIGFMLGLGMIFCSWRSRYREPRPVLPGRTVDVFVPTYREPVSLVRWTLIAAKEISYPHKTFLLDDGNRPVMKALAEELDVKYYAREHNIGAKAGNLNHGLSHSTAEFVLVLDADHIAMRNALDVTLGFFADPRVALVQTPEDFYNIDAFQYFNARRSGGLWHDQSFFYTISEPARDAYNGASCIGTGVVYRRSALDEIGGIPADTVTEDMHTSLKLHKAGHETVYLNEPIAYGIASADMRDYYNTRHRWAHGNLHGLRIEKIFGRSKLTLAQRLSYLVLALNFLEGWQQILLFIVPVGALIFGLPPFDLTPLNVLIVLCFPLLAILLLQEIGGGLTRIWSNEIFSMARFPVHIVSWAALFIDRMPFRASSKRIKGRVDWKLLAPQLAVVGVSLVAFAIGVFMLWGDFRTGPLVQCLSDLFAGRFDAIKWTERLENRYNLDLLVVAGFWAIFNAAKAVALVMKALANAKHSSVDYRFETHFLLAADTDSGPVLAHVHRMSKSWISARLSAEDAAQIEKSNSGRLYIPGGSIGIHWRTQQITAGARGKSRSGRRAENDLVELKGNLIWSNDKDQEQLIRALYSVDWGRELVRRTAFFLTPLDAIGNLLRLRAPWGERPRQWWPALFRDAIGREPRLVIVSEDRKGSTTILAFRELRVGSQIRLEMAGRGQATTKTFEIEGTESLFTFGRVGLDGAQVRKYRAVEKIGAEILRSAKIAAVQAGAAE